jgi:hypothetical protein
MIFILLLVFISIFTYSTFGPLSGDTICVKLSDKIVMFDQTSVIHPVVKLSESV